MILKAKQNKSQSKTPVDRIRENYYNREQKNLVRWWKYLDGRYGRGDFMEELRLVLQDIMNIDLIQVTMSGARAVSYTHLEYAGWPDFIGSGHIGILLYFYLPRLLSVDSHDH